MQREDRTIKTSNDPDFDARFDLTGDQVESYRRDGFVHLQNMLAGDALTRLRDAVAGAVDAESAGTIPSLPTQGSQAIYAQIFNQKVNLWQRWPAVARWVTGKRFGQAAADLEGLPMRVWHDQALFKGPGRAANNKTPWHQDSPYWPHVDRGRQTTIWIALRDATIQNGCMSFVTGTHRMGMFPPVNLADPSDLFAYVPHIKPVKPKTIQLKAGDCTFHNGLTFHYAGPNHSDGVREAFAIIYMPDGTQFNGDPHVVTDAITPPLSKGDVFDGAMFPLVGH